MSLKKLVKHSLSDGEIKRFFNNKINVLKYSELDNYTNVNQIMKEYGCIILFENNELNRGHWTLIHYVYRPNKKPFLNFFDSYGIIPENQLNYIPKSFKLLSEQQRGNLLDLLLNQPYQVRYSQYKLQKLGPNINTCGRWCCVRAYYRDLDENQFNDAFKMPYDKDDLITLVYESLAQ
jgi:hypothetical protein